MTFASLLATVVTALDRHEIPHMIAGSLASTYHGEPRTTVDIDLVIDPGPGSLHAFVENLDPSRFYVGDAAGALARRDQFNVIETSTGWKVDLVICKDRPFSRSELSRRRPADIAGVAVHVATAEDTILAKLEWARAGGSDRQRRDVAGIVAVTGDHLDLAYLRHWAPELGVAEDLEVALSGGG